MAYASCVLPQWKQAFLPHKVVRLVMLPVGLEKFRAYVKHVKFYLETVNKAMWCLSHSCQLGRAGCWVLWQLPCNFTVLLHVAPIVSLCTVPWISCKSLSAICSNFVKTFPCFRMILMLTNK